MELKLDKDEYTVGYARIGGGVLVLTNLRLFIDRGFRVFGKKTKSILIKDIIEVKSGKSFFFGTGIEIKYVEEKGEHTIFSEFTEAAKAKEIIDKIRSLRNGDFLISVDVPKGEIGSISLEEAEQIALDFMEKKAGNLKVDEIKHFAGAWNIILSNHDKYAVVVGDDGKVEAWKKLTLQTVTR
ncbi:MAG: hypothetical protein J5U17_10310 [Candidatus Methanoperedens sp.]|nr:hypothetical protein [Candidatus Methanoperedens sp.]MCE8428262.1 hypothetical protein [Candidatus Methanoperedens sp.]